MKNADITWDDANLDKYLANPNGVVHGKKMFVNLPARPIGSTSSPIWVR
jgi:filamentous hemagglutinin family protein